MEFDLYLYWKTVVLRKYNQISTSRFKKGVNSTVSHLKYMAVRPRQTLVGEVKKFFYSRTISNAPFISKIGRQLSLFSL